MSLEQKRAQIREKRRNALAAYYGDVNSLLKDLQSGEAKQRIRTFSQATFDEIIFVLSLLNSVYDSATVIHGPRGCGAAELYLNSVSGNKSRWSVTNLNERDTIMGGDTKLRDAVLALYQRYRPSTIFVVATPAVAINNDDIQAVVDELTEELRIKIVPIYSDGFKSKIGITGDDLSLHALVKYLVSNDQGIHEDHINLLSVSENRQDLAEIERLINELGLKVNILPRFSRPENLAKAGRARLSVSINPDDSDYLGEALQEKNKIRFVQAQIPIGIEGTYRWLSALSEALNLQGEGEKLHIKELKGLTLQLERQPLSGIRVYISLPTATALGIADLAVELGAEVIGLNVHYVDMLHVQQLAQFAVSRPELQLHVAQGQPFEEANILQRLKPDLYIGGAGQTVWVGKSGIPAISIDDLGILGYRGAARFISRAEKAINNQYFVQKLAEGTASLYQNNWYSKSPNWYIKLEVK